MPDRLLELAADARSRMDHESGQVSTPWSAETRAAIRALATHLVEVEGMEQHAADRAVTRWIITRKPIRECVRAEVAGEP